MKLVENNSVFSFSFLLLSIRIGRGGSEPNQKHTDENLNKSSLFFLFLSMRIGRGGSQPNQNQIDENLSNSNSFFFSFSLLFLSMRIGRTMRFQSKIAAAPREPAYQAGL